MPKLFVKNGNVIDVASDTIYQASILIEGERIAKIYTSPDQMPFSENGIPTINAAGKWILPGLIDMHVHIKESYAPLFVAAGVTTVRNTGGNVLELMNLIEAPGNAPTPRVYSADRIIDGPPGLWGETSPWNINIDEPSAARAEVIRQVEAGADLIKVYGWLSREVMEAVVDEAKKHRKEVSCDLIHSTSVNAIDAAKIGVKWNEHASGIIQAMYPEWNMKADKDVWEKVNWLEPEREKITEVCSQLSELGVILCPTMVLYDQMDHLPNHWEPERNSFTNNSLDAQWENLSQRKDALKRTGIQSTLNKAIAKIYFELGGTVVAGTDTPAGVWTYPGMALHRELELLVEAGFSEIDALRAATLFAAQAMGRPELGVIKEEALADIVLLNSNPLDTIRNTQDIDLVIKGGRAFSQEELFDSVPTEEEARAAYEKFLKSFQDGVYAR
ncbi:imidazolonepropionase [Neobacillus piezotolerans]|uniref:Imidazolonepropionase n=1 Tax=Neobacillus piezotolerans TaxID=2259171 RepID=A0A3D8GTI3_9BACI|nr:amidohydrolase family protein [Neobacillus piezotolerans]RDU37758.1 imidazolonepropionase [Neobacillus piezotolerans]